MEGLIYLTGTLLAAFWLWQGRSPASRWLASGLGVLGLAVFGLAVGPLNELLWEMRHALRLLSVALLLVGAWKLKNFSSAASPAQSSMNTLTVPYNPDNSYDRALALAKSVGDRIEQFAKSLGRNLERYDSGPGNSVIFTKIEYRLPHEKGNLSLRSSIMLEVERMDFHRFDLIMKMTVEHGGHKIEKGGLIELDDRDIGAIDQYLSGNGDFPTLMSKRVRTFPLFLWMPANRVTRLSPDWPKLAWFAGGLLSLFIPVIGVLIAAGVAIGYRFWNKRRRRWVLTTGKSRHEPRTLLRLDSWQANIPELGSRLDEVRQELVKQLTLRAPEGVTVSPQPIWYSGPQGKVERQQIVLALRRAFAHVHCESYGSDLFLAWDSHVNAAVWQEETLRTGLDRISGELVAANRVSPSIRALCEYDLIDNGFLTEWLHSVVTRVAKQKLEEFKIDAEIDFTIQRESRRGALNSSEDQKTSKPAEAAKRVLRRLS